MIYLKPTGGLCNRMRSIDSMISVCKKKRVDLTILWINDWSLNCPFNELFKIPVFEEFNFQIIECPIGFPELYAKNHRLLKPNNTQSPFSNSLFIRKLKNRIKGRSLNREQERMKKILEKVDETKIITNEKLKDIYDSQNYGGNMSVREMDEIFLTKVEKEINDFCEQNQSIKFISSCYRLHTRENTYKYFIPTDENILRIDYSTSNFSNTIGLHIRRTDHTASKSVSSTDKFNEVIESCLLSDSTTNFFLSTDDDSVKKNLIDRFGNRIMSNKVRSYSRNSEGAIKDALVDLYCLSRTKKIYGSHLSSFSQTAADIGDIEEVTAK